MQASTQEVENNEKQEIIENRENTLKLNIDIYPPSVSRHNRNTYHHQSRIRISMEDDEVDIKPYTTLFDKFLKILSKPPKDRNESEINLIIHYLYLTEIIEKFKIEQDIISDTALKSVMEICASNIKLQTVQCGEVLFKIDDTGDKVYIILKGSVSVLKPKPCTEVFTVKEYLSYLKELKGQNENYIVQQIIAANFDIVPIEDTKHLDKIFLYFFKHKCRKALIEESLEKLQQIFENKEIFTYTYKDFKIDIDKVRELHDKYRFHSTRAHIESKNPWVVYVSEKLNFSHNDIVRYDKFREMYKNKEKKKFQIFKYHKFLYLCAGQYFGDMALNTKYKRRNATIRAEEDSMIGYVEHDIYVKYIRSENLKVRGKECQFINESFFDYAIASSSIEKYFSNFTPHCYLRGYEIYKENTNFTHVVLVKEGEVELNFNGSVLDIYNLIKNIVDKTINFHKANKNLSILSEEDIIYLMSLVKDLNLERLINKSPEFIQGINKKRTSYICLLPTKETCGIEEFFLDNMFYFCTARVCSNDVKVIKIDSENLKTILTNENMTNNYFTKKSMNKIVSLIKRLNHIKSTLCDKLLKDSLPIEHKSRDIDVNTIDNRILNKYEDKKYNMSSTLSPLKLKKDKPKRKIVYSYSSYNNQENLKYLNDEINNQSGTHLKSMTKHSRFSSMEDLKHDENTIKSLKLTVKNFIDKSLHTQLNENFNLISNTNNPSLQTSTREIDQIVKENEKIRSEIEFENNNVNIANIKLKRVNYHSRSLIKSFNSPSHPVSFVNLLGHDTNINYNNNPNNIFITDKSSLNNNFTSINSTPEMTSPQYLPNLKKISALKSNRLPKIDLRKLKNEQESETDGIENKKNFNLYGQDHKSNTYVSSHDHVSFSDTQTPNYPSMNSTRIPLHFIKSSKQIDIPEDITYKDPISVRLDDVKNRISSMKASSIIKKKFKIKKKKLNGNYQQ